MRRLCASRICDDRCCAESCVWPSVVMKEQRHSILKH
jgi:hypothetical protein